MKLLYSLQYGDTPLHLAARESHLTCVGCLLSTPGIDVNIKNHNHKTAVMEATEDNVIMLLQNLSV